MVADLARSRNRCGGGVWERDLTTSTEFGWLKQLNLGVEMVEMWWEERGGRDESGRGKMSSIMRVVGGLAELMACSRILVAYQKGGAPLKG